MKKKIILVKEVGEKSNEKTDKKIVKIIKKEEGKAELFIYCEKFTLNEFGEYIRSKGVNIFPTGINVGIQYPHRQFDEVIALDDFGKENKDKFELKEKEKTEDKKGANKGKNKNNKGRNK